MKKLENFLINFLISIVILTFIADGALNSPRISAAFTLCVFSIIINRFLMGFNNAKQ